MKSFIRRSVLFCLSFVALVGIAGDQLSDRGIVVQTNNFVPCNYWSYKTIDGQGFYACSSTGFSVTVPDAYSLINSVNAALKKQDDKIANLQEQVNQLKALIEALHPETETNN